MLSTTLEAASISPHGIAVLIFTILVFAMFVWDRFPIATVCLGILFVLPIGFAIVPLTIQGLAVDPTRFFAGFAHPALIAICSLMVLGHGLVVTGALEPVAQKLSSLIVSKPQLALLALLVGPAAVSGVINDTPVVVLLIPLIIAAASRAKMAAAKMLLPMNYAVLIGGMATTIGTSTNLIVVALATQLGVAPFGIFSFLPIVAMAAIPAILYLWLIAPKILKSVAGSPEQLVETVFEAELHVEKDSWLEGRELRKVFEATGHKMQVLAVKRANRAMAKMPTLELKAGDRLSIQGTAAQLKDFEASLKAPLHEADLLNDAQIANAADTKAEAEEKAKAETLPQAVLAQMIITSDSPLVGRSLKDGRLADQHGVIVVGVRQRSSESGWQRHRLSEKNLGTGDILLLQGDIEAMQQAQRAGVGLLLDARLGLPRQEKATLALITMAAVVLLAATKTLPIAVAALTGVFLLIATRCLAWSDVTHSLSAKVVLLVSASLALGDALELTGVTQFMALKLALISQEWAPSTVLVVLIGVMGLLTNFVSNNAAAAIGTPLGIELARQLGVPPEPFVLAVLFGCNLCYLTPMGYQTNLLVMNAGGYKFSDFVKVGTPLFLIMWLGLAYGIVHRYGL